MKVSLIVPAYNVEHLIEYTLNSVKNQTLKDFECIIVNDFSTDNTKEVVSRYIKADKRFRLINHRANAGLSAARNTGLRFAKGQYVAFLDSDDLIMPDSLKIRVKTLDMNLDAMVIGTYAGSITIDMNTKIPPLGKEVELKIVDFITAGGNCPFNANQPMFITELFKRIGGFDHSLKQAEDYDMWMRVFRYGFKIIPTKKQLVTYRQTEGSMIRNNPLLHLEVSHKRFTDCYSEYENKKFSDKFPVHLNNSLADYRTQLDIANRVLEFIGLGLSKGEKIDVLSDKLVDYLPDYFQIIEAHRPFEQRIKVGIDRYFKKKIDLNTPEYQELSGNVHKLYQEFKRKIQVTALKSLQNDNGMIQFDFENIVGLPGVQEKIDLIFIPHKDYHVHTIYLMSKELEKLNITYIIVDISMHYRDEGVKQTCLKYDLPFIGYSNFILGNFKPKAITVFNDWDPIVRSIVNSAKKAGIPTIGIVEGIQDYLDADTKQDRKAYRTVEHLFLPGEHDKKYFTNSEQNLLLGGIPRIYDLYHRKRKENIQSNEKIALINSNFSYGVLEECRDEWLKSAVEGCMLAGFKPIISRHPADKGILYPELVMDKSFYEALEIANVLISRFASGILEALAVGIQPIYFNPHGEKVDKFFDSLNAYPIVNNLDELVKVLKLHEDSFAVYKKNFDKFLEYHCGDTKKECSYLISKQIKNIIQNAGQTHEKGFKTFSTLLIELDQKSGCFNNLNAISEIISKERKDEITSDCTIRKVLSLQEVNQLIKNREYVQASAQIKVLLSRSPDNPAYKSVMNTINGLMNVR